MENKVLEVLVNAGKPLRPGDIAKELGVDSKEVSTFNVSFLAVRISIL